PARGAVTEGEELVDGGDEGRWVGVEGEDEASTRLAHARVPVLERISERAVQATESLVEREIRIDLAPIGQKLAPAAHAGAQRSDHDFSGARVPDDDIAHRDLARTRKGDPLRQRHTA